MRDSLGGMVSCVGCLGYHRMCGIPDSWAQNASSILHTLRRPDVQRCPIQEAGGTPGRTPLWTFTCHSGELEPRSVGTEGTEKF